MSAPPSTQHTARSTQRYGPLLLAAVCALAFFWQLGGNGLFDLDEALYAACAREMHLRGDYVTPRVNGQPFFEKPPLAYWAASGMFRLFGVNEFAVRLPSALATVLLVGLIFWFGSRQFGPTAGLLAALFFALSPLTLGAARQLTMDALLNLWIALAMVCFFQGVGCAEPSPTPDTRHPTPWSLGFWAACGLGVLTKGAPGIVLPLLIVFVSLLFAEQFQVRRVLRAFAAMRLPTGLLLFLLIAVPWHVAAWQASGEAFTGEYIVRQHLQRFQGGDTAHRAPFWFYVPSFLLLFFPWSLFVPSALASPLNTHHAPRNAQPASPTRLLLKIWAVVVFVVFSASGSKLISYILPMYPAAALLVGDWCAQAIERKEMRGALLFGTGIAFALALLLHGIVLFHEPILRLIGARTNRPDLLAQIPPGLMVWVTHLLGVVVMGIGAAFALMWWERRRAAFGALVAGMIAFVGIAVIEGLPVIDAAFAKPLHALARRAGRETQAGVPLLLYVGPPRRPSILFYLPDALFRDCPPDAPCVPEVMQEAEARRWLRQKGSALVLTDDRKETGQTEGRLARLLADPGVRLMEQRGGWALLRIEMPPGARAEDKRRGERGDPSRRSEANPVSRDCDLIGRMGRTVRRTLVSVRAAAGQAAILIRTREGLPCSWDTSVTSAMSPWPTCCWNLSRKDAASPSRARRRAGPSMQRLNPATTASHWRRRASAVSPST